MSDKMCLTVDFEDEHHCENLDMRFESSLSDFALSALLDVMDRSGRVTIFVVAEIAKKYREFLGDVIARGHEIGSHSASHRMLPTLLQSERCREITTSKKILEDELQVSVYGFRAPNFAFESSDALIAMEAGYAYESSGLNKAWLHPRALVGARLPVGLKSFDVCGRWYPPGGGYLRLFPSVINARNLVENQSGAKQIYVHPWEFERTSRFEMASGMVARFKHRVNLNSTPRKVSALFPDGSSIPAREILSIN
ncbi:MAG: hypothetical protein CML33_02855 [Rhodobacteraceae bacterium]|nr:hypothetical protein [Paracoccaceae bacterium]